MSPASLSIVAVHGNGGGASRYARMAAALPANVHFHAVTLPGFSTEPRDPALQTLPDYADRLALDIEATAEASGTAPVVLGHGIGGSMALDLASRRPDLFGGLILHALVGANLDTRLFPRIMSTAPVRALAKKLIAARLPRPIWRRLFFPTGAPKADIDVFFDEYRHAEAFGQMFEIITAEWFESLEPVRDVPSIVLWGEHDRVLKSGQAEAIHALVPDAEVIVQPEWDHFPMLEQPDEYSQVIVELAERLSAVT